MATVIHAQAVPTADRYLYPVVNSKPNPSKISDRPRQVCRECPDGQVGMNV